MAGGDFPASRTPRESRCSIQTGRPQLKTSATVSRMPAIYEHLLTVTPEHIDRLGHVNNLEYLRGRGGGDCAFLGQGWPTEAYEQMGAGFVVRSHEIKYQQSAFAGDEVAVRTWVADFRRLSCLRRYKIIRRRDEVVLATAATEWAFVNFGTFALARIPQEVATAFEIVPRLRFRRARWHRKRQVSQGMPEFARMPHAPQRPVQRDYYQLRPPVVSRPIATLPPRRPGRRRCRRPPAVAELLVEVAEQHAGRHGGHADREVVPAVGQALAFARYQLCHQRFLWRLGQRIKNSVRHEQCPGVPRLARQGKAKYTAA